MASPKRLDRNGVLFEIHRRLELYMHLRRKPVRLVARASVLVHPEAPKNVAACRGLLKAAVGKHGKQWTIELTHDARGQPDTRTISVDRNHILRDATLVLDKIEGLIMEEGRGMDLNGVEYPNYFTGRMVPTIEEARVSYGRTSKFEVDDNHFCVLTHALSFNIDCVACLFARLHDDDGRPRFDFLGHAAHFESSSGRMVNIGNIYDQVMSTMLEEIENPNTEAAWKAGANRRGICRGRTVRRVMENLTRYNVVVTPLPEHQAVRFEFSPREDVAPGLSDVLHREGFALCFHHDAPASTELPEGDHITHRPAIDPELEATVAEMAQKIAKMAAFTRETN